MTFLENKRSSQSCTWLYCTITIGTSRVKEVGAPPQDNHRWLWRMPPFNSHLTTWRRLTPKSLPSMHWALDFSIDP